MESKNEQARDLWTKFYVISQEMLKYIEQDNIDMFLPQLEQRLQVQRLLEDLGGNAWVKTGDGQELYQKLMPLDRQIHYQARLWLNKVKQNRKASNAYELMASASVGQILNQKL